MDHQESTDIAVIKNDVRWLRQTMVEKFAEVSEQIRVIPIAIDTITKRTDSLEKEVNRVRNQLNNHLDYTENMIAEHQVNTRYREKNQWIFQNLWLVISFLGLPGVVFLVQFVFNLISSPK